MHRSIAVDGGQKFSIGTKTNGSDPIGVLFDSMKKFAVFCLVNLHHAAWSAERNGAVHVWESANGGIVYTLSEHKDGITGLAWRPDGGVLATTGEDGKLVLWSMDDGFPLRAVKAHEKKSSDRYTRLTGALDVAYLPNGGLFTSGRDRALRLWTTDGAKLKSLPEIPDLPLAATVTHDGSKALTGHRDGRVLLWDLKSGSSTELPR